MNMTMKNNTNITYRTVGYFRIPNLTLPPEESTIRLGKWGMIHKDYLEKRKPVLFVTLLTQGRLYQHCAEIDTQAQQMFDTLVSQMIKAENITEQLKEDNQLEWVRRVNNICERVTEKVSREMIYI